MARRQLDFGVRNTLDPTRGAQAALGSIGDIMNTRDKLAQQEFANQQALVASDQAARRLGVLESDEARKALAAKTKAAQDKAMSAILAGTPEDITTYKDVTTGYVAPTAAIPGNQAQIDAVAAANAAKQAQIDVLNLGVEDGTKKYDTLVKQYTAENYAPKFTDPMRGANVTAANRNQVVLREEPTIPGESKKTYYETADGRKISAFTKTVGGYDEVKEFSDTAPADLVSPDIAAVLPPGKAEADAQQRALQDSGLNELNTQFSNLDTKMKDAPALVKPTKATLGSKGVTKQVPVTKKLGDAQKSVYLKDQIMKDKTLSGTNKLLAANQIDKIYPPAKSMSVSDQLALLKYGNKIKGEATTVADYRLIYPNMPASVKTVQGAKAYASKYSKDKVKKDGTNFAKMLYTNLTGKDVGDVADIDAWLKDNSTKVKSMSKSDQSALIAKFTALYGEESDMDFTDYFGGSAAGDVLESRGL